MNRMQRNHKSVGRDAAILTISKAITLLVSLVSTMLLSRFRTLDEYGTFAQLIIISTLAKSLFTLGLPNSTNYFLARAETKEDRKQFLSVFYSLSTIICIFIGVLLIATIPITSRYFRNPSIYKFAYFLAVYPWTSVIIASISNVLVVYGEIKKLLLINLVNVCTSVITVIIVRVFEWSFNTYLMIYILCELCITIWIYVLVFRLEGGLKFNIDSNLILSILKYSIPIGLAALVSIINIEIDKIMIGRLFDTESLAIYTNAGKELPLTIVASSFTAVLLPRIAKSLKGGRTKETIEMWGYSVQLSYIIISFATMACIVFAPQIISILYSHKYLPGVGVFRVYSLVMILRVTYFGIVLNSIGETKFILYCSLLSLSLNAVLNYLLYLIFGFTGPAIATFLSIFFINALQLLVTARYLKVRLIDIWPWHKLFSITMVNIYIGIALYLLILCLNIQNDAKGNTIVIIIGFITLAAYFVSYRKYAYQLWKKLNKEY